MKFSILCLCAAATLLPVLGCQSTSPNNAQTTLSHTDAPLTGRSVADGGSIKNTANYLDDPTPITSPMATLTVHGLGCPLCAGNVDKQLMRVPGVESVKVNLNDGTATVHISPTVTPTRSQLAKAVYESGFTLIKIDE